MAEMYPGSAWITENILQSRLFFVQVANRVVPLSDPAYVDEMRWLFASTRESFEDDVIIGERRAAGLVGARPDREKLAGPSHRFRRP